MPDEFNFDQSSHGGEFQSRQNPFASFKEIQEAEQSGNITSAYNLAMQSGDRFTANRLASEHGIEEHEFTDFPPQRGRDFSEVMAEALESRIRPGKTAEKLGFRGFEDKVVVDVGTRDGRFVPMFEGLGAKEIWGVDPDAPEIAKAIDRGVLDSQHAISTTLREAIPQMPRADVATIFNFNIPIALRDEFISDLWFALDQNNGQALITVAERDVANDILPRLRKAGFNVRHQRLWDGGNDGPHAYLLVCSKIPNKGLASFNYGPLRREG